MIKYFASDLDGTLLNADYAWDTILDEGMKAILRDGYEFVVTTGRTIAGVKGCEGLWALPVHVIVMNGALILDKDNTTLFRGAIKKRTVAGILDAMPHANLEFFTEDKILTMLPRKKYIEEYMKWDIWRKKVLDNGKSGYLDEYLSRFHFQAKREEILKLDILKINGLELHQDKRADLLDRLTMFENDIVNASFDSNVFELTDRAISKASALMFLAHRKQWDKQKIAVFGDGGNDMDMLMSFVHSYAPENAQEQVKKVVSEIIASNDQYGVLKKIMQIAADNRRKHTPI